MLEDGHQTRSEAPIYKIRTSSSRMVARCKVDVSPDATKPFALQRGVLFSSSIDSVEAVF
jgi:hypothetical protein